MSKQIKLGFDKVPTPIVEQYLPLYDINSGTVLRDEAGNIIVTTEKDFIRGFRNQNNSVSTHINNETIGVENNTVPIAEVFQEQSPVSRTLLGVERAEVQLGLYSDVSTYGLDENNWNYFTFSSPQFYPNEWYRRNHPVYGPHGSVEFKEYTEEQALALRAFPVKYNFPYGPRWEELGRYNSELFSRYLNFIATGKILYNYFSQNGYENYAKNNFISDLTKIVDENENELTSYTISVTSGVVGADVNRFYDVKYEDFSLSFDEIERFTIFYENFIGGNFVSPFPQFNPSNDLYRGILNNTENVRPGAGSGGRYYGVLESNESFRYQPGRISGFTFGLRANIDTSTLSNTIEWGAVNSTDQYVFQIQGSRFNIVRRSTVSLFDENPELADRLGFNREDEVYRYQDSLDNRERLYELVIPSTKFNGDRLDGTGPSGYILDPEKVTMYKIEFGWYGAIGAKFYAYVPVENDEARWVLLHTLVIENGLGKPCLENPEFKFRYFLSVNDTSQLNEPIYVYKYGASYYIDGGDEGNFKNTVKTTEPVSFSDDTPLIGLLPKNFVENKDGQLIENNRVIYPDGLSVNTDETVRLSFRKIKGSPDGVHFHYSPSIHNQISKKTKEVELLVSSDNTSVTIQNGSFDTVEDNNKKVIADGLYNTYISNVDEFSGDIYRYNWFSLNQRPIGDEVLLTDGTVIQPANQTFTAKLTGLNDTILATNTAIESSEFIIHWLNPVPRDPRISNRHFSDFAFSITEKEPSIEDVVDPETSETVQELRFGNNSEKYDFYTDRISMVSNQSSESLNIDGIESGEWSPTYGVKFEIDPRLPRPSGEDSGDISLLYGKVALVDYNITETSVDGSFYRLYFQSPSAAPDITDDDVGYIDVGIDGNLSNINIESTIQSETVVENEIEVEKYYILVSGSDAGQLSGGDTIQLKIVSLESRFRIQNYDSSGNNRFERKLLTQNKIVKFSSDKFYIVLGMQDYARVNGVVVEEIYPTYRFTYNPEWITTSESIDSEGNDINYIVNSGGSSIVNSPSNFFNDDRLSGVSFDSQTRQPLRPGNDIYNLFVDQDYKDQIKLDDVFNRDRYKLTRTLRNNEALFLIANRVDAAGDISVTITNKEQ